MSEEYLKRYYKDFIPFHNPIETGSWLPYRKKDYGFSGDKVTILYSGRIGMGITDSIYETAEVVDILNKDGVKINLHIQTPTKDEKILNRLKSYKSVIINPFAELKDLPEIFSEADILLLANDFTAEGIDFLRLSMPTKASEYMISGAPVLVYSPEETAVSKFFSSNKCGYCITRHDKNEILKAIRFLIDHEEIREELGKKAVELALSKFSAEKVRETFQGLLFKQV
jgi:glycosyltransferase involved in cell wall biosynthesis